MISATAVIVRVHLFPKFYFCHVPSAANFKMLSCQMYDSAHACTMLLSCWKKVGFPLTM